MPRSAAVRGRPERSWCPVGGDDGEVVVGDERFELGWPGAGEGGDEWTFDECRGSPERVGCGCGLGREGEPGEPAARRGGQVVAVRRAASAPSHGWRRPGALLPTPQLATTAGGARSESARGGQRSGVCR